MAARSARLIFVLIFCRNVITASTEGECQNDDLYVIRSMGPNGLVVDATDAEQVKIQHFTGSETQLWKFVPAGRPGLSFIINEHHNKALDYIRGADGHLHVAVRDLDKSLQQQWNFDVKGHFVNVADGRNVDIDSAKYVAGNRLIIWKDNGCSCQQFLLQKKI